MTQEQKQLLLKDLCGRFPYGVICKISYTFNNETTNGEDVESTCDDIITKINFDTKEVFSDWLSEYSSIDDVKPYLRPMSSMTEEEKSIMDSLWKENNKLVFADPDSIRRYRFYDISVVDFLNKRHLDYRGLIEKGLALEAPEDMY